MPGDPNPPARGRPPALPPGVQATTITVGTFDGVHRGHWAVLRALRERARRRDSSSVVVTFDPHPLRVVRPDEAPALLTTPEEKKELLAGFGLDYAIFLRFTPALARYPPRRFVEEILIGQLRLADLVVGYDHGLGRGRSGDVDTLRRLGEELGFDLHVVPAVDDGQVPFSSTRIRDALLDGDVVAASRALGLPYSLRGPVVRGEGRGAALGVPTANIHVDHPDKLLPAAGVYAVRVALAPPVGSAPPSTHDGVLHIGPRPTFPGMSPSVEVHIFDFDRDIYGVRARVDLCGRLRPVHAFDSAAALTRQMHRDIEVAREHLERGAGACQ